jgi:hypothetical protein
MNMPEMREQFRIAFSPKTLSLARLTSLGAILIFLSVMATAGPAAALVGPSRLAPEFVPYVVMVLDKTGDSASYCSASVIAPDIVLTAAHCVSSPSHTQVFYRGQDDLILFDVESLAIHPDYTPNLGERDLASIDLALLRLSRPLPPFFKPVELTDSFQVKAGQPLRIAGYGIASEVAREPPGLLRTGILSVIGPLSPLFVKLKDPEGRGLGGCTGDSGAPIFAIGSLRLVAVAIRAKGINGYSCGDVTEAVLIGPQLPWLHKSIEDLSAPGRPRIWLWLLLLLLAAALAAILRRTMSRPRPAVSAEEE